MKKRIIIFLDLDGVIVVGYKKSKVYEWGIHDPFDRKAVMVLNRLYDELPYEIVVSSDWRNSFTLEVLQRIFKHFKIKAPVVDITPNSGGYIMENLEGGRIEEITKYLSDNEDILAWVAVDDLQMYELEHFVECPKWIEGIKQTGIESKILIELKKQIDAS